MKKILTAGVVLGLSVAVWSFIFGFTGLYRSSSTAWIFTVVAILIQVGVLIWGLKQTAADGKRYLGQVGAGLLMCLIAGVIIICSSFIFTSVFTDYFEVTAELQADAWSNSGMSDERVDELLETMSWSRTPMVAAISGFIGTMVTGLIVTLIVAAFVRKKD